MSEVQGIAASVNTPVQRFPVGAESQGVSPVEQEPPSKERPTGPEGTDKVELSDASKALAKLAEQNNDAVELRLPPEKLRELVHG